MLSLPSSLLNSPRYLLINKFLFLTKLEKQILIFQAVMKVTNFTSSRTEQKTLNVDLEEFQVTFSKFIEIIKFYFL